MEGMCTTSLGATSYWTASARLSDAVKCRCKNAMQAQARADSARAPTSSASLKRFSRVHEVGPMVHTILVFLNVLESWESLQGRISVTASSDDLTYSH